MDGKLEVVRRIPYRTKEIKIYRDGRASFADIIFRDENEAKFYVDLLLRTMKIETREGDRSVLPD